MKSFYVTVHLPAVGTVSNGLAGVVTPSGVVESRTILYRTIQELHDPRAWAETLIIRMFPGYGRRMHGSVVVHEQITDTSAQVHIIRVDCDD